MLTLPLDSDLLGLGFSLLGEVDLRGHIRRLGGRLLVSICQAKAVCVGRVSISEQISKTAIGKILGSPRVYSFIRSGFALDQDLHMQGAR